MVEFGGDLITRLKTKMSWHQNRASVLARNVANAETPGYRPRDLEKVTFSENFASPSSVALNATHQAHRGVSGSANQSFASKIDGEFEVIKGGNAVTLEVEMAKVTENQLDHEAATVIYQRMLGLFKLANR